MMVHSMAAGGAASCDWKDARHNVCKQTAVSNRMWRNTTLFYQGSKAASGLKVVLRVVGRASSRRLIDGVDC
jgi:hypothetical protein